MTSDPLLSGILLLLLLFYALCTACETSLTFISEAGKSRLSEDPSPQAEALIKIVERPEHFQSGVHLAALCAETVYLLFGSCVLARRLPIPGAGAIAAAGAILAALLWLFGRMIPRRIAMNEPERTAMRLCPPLRVLVLLLTPVTAFFMLLTKGILFLFHIDTSKDPDDVSEDEIMAMVDIGEESGAIEADEREMIENVFEFNNLTAGDVMVHRTDIEVVWVEDSKEEILALIERSGLSRFPVCNEDADDVIGILYTRDYLLNLQKESPLPMRQLLRKAYFVPESVRTDILFHDMQSRAVQVAMVVDEYGGIGGLVTLEDLLEELVGNIYDEFDPKEESDAIPLSDGRWRMAGSLELERLEELLQPDLPEEPDADTLGGLVLSCLSVIPDDGETPTVETCGLRIRVETIVDRRIEWCIVEKLPKPEESDET